MYFRIFLSACTVLLTFCKDDAIGSISKEDQIKTNIQETQRQGIKERSLSSPQDQQTKMIENIVRTNMTFVQNTIKDREYFANFKNEQTPRAIIIGCSDSSFQLHALDERPENDIFVLRNFGNHANSRGDLDYAVHHLNVPLIIVIGHTACDAIKLVTKIKGLEGLEERIVKTVQNIRIDKKSHTPTDQLVNENVAYNVMAQATDLTYAYSQKVRSGELLVLGAVYDLYNDYKKGTGKLVFISVNGKDDFERLKGIKGISIKH